MQFTRLRLSGFKSFVDPTELRIEPGLTAIVGPNGCGKSNLVEALRWVMGETSPKSMRGGEMEDVIFSGTERRPSRNLAEVSVFIDNSERRAPAVFNDSDGLEVIRRLERDAGSAYRINGRDVRAKDVQLLFADAATGAHSPALVSQGRIGALIAAKPRDRRAVLEEAAGISGLHSRRKEAEQRLRAAEANLARVQDVLLQFENQIAGLKRQARQAVRYRNVSKDIRRTEAAILYVRWRDASDEAGRLEEELQAVDSTVSERAGTLAALSREQTELAAALPEARRAEAEAAAGLQRLAVARDSLEAEETRRCEAMGRLETQLCEIATDEARERESREDAAAALGRLDAERARLEEAERTETAQVEKAREQLDRALQEAADAESRFDTESQRLVEARGRRASLSSDLTALHRRLERLRLDREDCTRAFASLEEAAMATGALVGAEAEIAAREAEIAAIDERVAEAECATAAAREARDAAREARSRARSELAALKAEAEALEKRLAAGESDSSPPIADSIRVAPGYERALGAALGADLDASEDPGATVRWTALPALSDPPPLPAGATPLGDRLEAPAALARRIALTGVVADEAEGAALAPSLRPGQRLVSLSGALWRWDGLVQEAGAPTAAALRLMHRNRLAELASEGEKLRQSLASSESRLAEAEERLAAAAAAESDLQTGRERVVEALRTARSGLADLEAAANRHAAQRAGLEETARRLDGDIAEASGQAGKIERMLADLPDLQGLEETVAGLRTEVEERRRALAEVRAAHDALRREGEARRERLKAIDSERETWQRRLERADGQLAQFARRAKAAREERDGLVSAPGEVEAKRQALAGQIEAAETLRKQTADALAAAETALAEKDRAVRGAQEELASAREARARADAALENSRRRKEEISAACKERYHCAPEDVLGETGAGNAGSVPPLDDLDRRLERYRAERERLGAVNLRAEEELREVEEQLAHLLGERQDLEGAIHRLRQAIRSLNREGRERLLAAFAEVDRHFGALFAALFGGGEARLELVESDDPLEAGLEIMASPPGKRLQTLSLLSGGEQALTALSLIFAVFMTNPAPICVLDEVDAPLDEANVERFCNLLDEMVARTATRFLIVTHNEVTMARMHRLFGVTMAEKGVSQLVSVDLERAEALAAAE